MFCKPSPEQNKVTLMRCFCTLKTKISVGFLLFGSHALSVKDTKGQSQAGQTAQYRCKCIGVFFSYWLIDFLTLHSQIPLFQCNCKVFLLYVVVTSYCTSFTAHRLRAHALIDTHYTSLPLLRLLETRLMMVRPTRSLHCAAALWLNTNTNTQSYTYKKTQIQTQA